MAAKKNPMQRALDQADAITSGNKQLENLTQGSPAGPGPLFNDRRASSTGGNANKLKLAQQVLASHKSKLTSAADKDQVRRQIAATQQRIKELGG